MALTMVLTIAVYQLPMVLVHSMHLLGYSLILNCRKKNSHENFKSDYSTFKRVQGAYPRFILANTQNLMSFI